MFLGSAAVTAGLVTRSQLAGPRFQRLHRGVYAPAGLRVDHRTWCRSALVLVPDAVVVGRSAAWLLGARSAARARDPVELAVAPDSPAPHRTGIAARQVCVEPTEVVVREGLSVTSGLRTAWDLGARLRPDNGVPIIDEMLHRRIIGAVDLEAFAAGRDRWPGSAQARRAVALSDEKAESPPESRVRLALDAAGIRPRTQVDVHDEAGRWIARVDMAYEDERIAVEYDGGWHAEPGQLSRDRDRLNRLQAAGWTVVFVTAPDLWNLHEVVDKIRGALARARTVAR